MIIRNIPVLFMLTVAASGTVLINTTPAAADTVLVSFQAVLTDSAGQPLPEGDYPMEFKFYDDSTGVVLLWTETIDGVYIGAHGVAHAFLSFVDEYVEGGFEKMNAIWMEILVAGETISPRTRLASVPHAAGARRVVGDILTRPGMVLVSDSTNDSGIVLAAESDMHTIRLHPPDPCVPPDPCEPALELRADVDAHVMRIHPPEPCVPPEPCAPALELIADTEIHSLKIHPPDPCAADPCAPAFEAFSDSNSNAMRLYWNRLPPDDGHPAFELATDANLEMVSMGLRPPPDDNTPSVELLVDVAGMASSIKLLPPPDDGQPGIELITDALAGMGSLRIGRPPPDDSKPSVEITSTLNAATLTLQGEDAAGAPPVIVMSADATAAKLGIGTDSLAEALTVMGNGWFSGDVFVFTLTAAKRNVEPIDGALAKVSQLNGYYYDCRTDEYQGLHLPADRQIGFLAEEVNQVVPEAVGENEYGLTGVSYSRLTALLVEAVKELKAENEALRSRVDKLEAR